MLSLEEITEMVYYIPYMRRGHTAALTGGNFMADKNFLTDIIDADLAEGKIREIHTRFPPEPNGYLHIGSAKAIYINWSIANQYGGKFNLRLDDTNPAREGEEYVNSIIEDLHWLGADPNGGIFYGSDYFDKCYEYAEKLIMEGKAYVDDLTRDEMREYRGADAGKPSRPSPYRDRTPEENLDLFERMKNGEFPDGSKVLRAKIDMAHPNMMFRDPLMYRIIHASHHRTGDKWCIYPMYDFAHGQCDSIERITHSICTLEFDVHRPLYDWFIEQLGIFPSHQYEFARLNLTYTVMSKRKLLQLVQEGHVSGWDDPRMPTVSGMRRRGYTPAAIRNFCHTIGITKFNGFTDVALLEYSVREDLNANAPRRMAVLTPLKVTITTLPENAEEMAEVLNNPEKPEEGVRRLPITREVWIERDDFMLDPPKKYFRLAPGRTVRLRGGCCVTCTDYKQDAEGTITEIFCEHIPGTIGSNPPEGIQCRAAIHWVSAKYAVDGEIRIYDRLFTEENPDAAEEGFLSVMNPSSLAVITNAKLEPSLAGAEPEFRCQFERLGYFVAARRAHVPGRRPVFNRTVALKDSWAKKQK